jgi:riboflavin synthase
MGIFTGLIMEAGRVRQMERTPDGARLIIGAAKVLEGTRIGDSISINGTDLTVVEMGSDYFTSDASLETLGLTTLGELQPGRRVNLERALGVGERLGGHMVQGHIDGTGTLTSVEPEGNAWRMRFSFPAKLGRYIAMKGSICIDGISLTVAGLGDDWFEVAIIPHTWRETTLSELNPGDAVNLEVDVLAKYVERLMQHEAAPESKLTLEYLKEMGYQEPMND